MADKTYKINFEMTDGTTQSVEFTVPQGEKGDTGHQGPKGDKGLDATPVTPLFAEGKEWLDANGDTSKFYVLPDGFIYACLYKEASGPAYINLAGNVSDGYRLNSSCQLKGGVTGSVVTDFVPVKKGQKLRVKGFNPTGMVGSHYPYIALYTDANESATLTTTATEEKWIRGDTGWPHTWTLVGDVYEHDAFFTDYHNAQHPLGDSVNYVRISGAKIDGAEIIVTVDEEINEGTASGYSWENTGHAFVPADYEDRIIALEKYVGIDSATSNVVNLLSTAKDADRSTIYNEVGYKTETRLSSSGPEAPHTTSPACASGYISAKAGDVLRVKNVEITSDLGWYVIAYDENNVKTGSIAITGDEKDAKYYLTVSELATDGIVLDEATFGSNFNAIRFSAITISENTVVTINEFEEMWDGSVSKSDKKWTGKKWVVVGDSLTKAIAEDGTNANTDKYYHTHIAEETGITVVNMGQGGTGYKKTDDSGYAFHQRIVNVPTDADVITIMGSINDLSRTENYTIGEPTDTGTETVCGCINTTLDTLFGLFPLANVGIITPMPNDYYNYPNMATDERVQRIVEYCEKLTEICRRRSIPVLDMFHGSGMRPWDTNFKTAFMPDGTHANEAGHKIMATKIKAFLQTLL